MKMSSKHLLFAGFVASAALLLAGCGGAANSSSHKATPFNKMPAVSTLKSLGDAYPEIMTFMDGSKVQSRGDWAVRQKEIANMYQYYMYGPWRDGSDEDVTYSVDGKTMTINIKRKSTGASGSMSVDVSLPDPSKVKMPEGGWPVVVGMHRGISEAVANNRGYATITFNSGAIAGDNNRRQGLFYTLYPYGTTPEEQTGVLMAWGWGASKILDALEAGAGKELKINGKNSIITGVSRYGKAAAVCGAFEKRFKMVAPSCSGAGGIAMYRYVSEGKTYDFTYKKASSSYKYTKNEPLDSLQATGEQGWFNSNFMEFKDPKVFPVDQHMLCSLCADPDRYLFIIGSCTGEDWINAPAMWLAYRAALPLFEYLDLGDHIVANIHKSGHAVIAEDMEYMCDYFNEKVYGIKSTRDLSPLKTSVFELPINKDPLFDKFGGTTPKQPVPDK